MSLAYDASAISHLAKNCSHSSRDVEYSATDGHIEKANHNNMHDTWTLHDSPIENHRPLKIIVIGAGYSGIYMGVRIPEKLRNCKLTIYEKNAGVGGTWYENRYPGAACDVAAHSYQFTFNPKPDWSSVYAPAEEIRQYLEDTTRKFGADRFMRLSHEVKECCWDQVRGRWSIKVQNLENDKVFDDDCDVLVNGRGLLNSKRWPNIEGLKTFKGEVMHSSGWNESYDFRNKRIGIIGNGSSAVQILPKLQKVPGAQLHCFFRSPTWIAPSLSQAVMDEEGMGDQLEYRPEQIERFKSDPKALQKHRLKLEAAAHSIHAINLKDTPMHNAAQQAVAHGMKARLAKKPHYYDWIKPDFALGCRRVTPGPGFLEALVEDNVHYIRDRILRVEPDGIVTADGVSHELNVIVCATGFYAGGAPPFPVLGINGHTLRHHWIERPRHYLSIATDGFPNYFMLLGPNSGLGEGSLVALIQSAGDYIVKAIRKLQKDNLKCMSVKPKLVRDFLRYSDAYFKTAVIDSSCSSWYSQRPDGSAGDVVTGVWPGSGLHALEALRSPRWEDFEYEAVPEEDGTETNLMGWLGNGWCVNQTKKNPEPEELAWYLDPYLLEHAVGVPKTGRPEDKDEYRLLPWSY